MMTIARCGMLLALLPIGAGCRTQLDDPPAAGLPWTRLPTPELPAGRPLTAGFLVLDGVIISPTLDGTSLVGITRGAVIQMAEDLGYEVRLEPVPRESLYTVDEIFFTGTAAEVTPVRSVDRIPIGSGKAGPISLALQKYFMETVKGQNDDPHGYLTCVKG